MCEAVASTGSAVCRALEIVVSGLDAGGSLPNGTMDGACGAIKVDLSVA